MKGRGTVLSLLAGRVILAFKEFASLRFATRGYNEEFSGCLVRFPSPAPEVSMMQLLLLR
jgi:hypothetical protein